MKRFLYESAGDSEPETAARPEARQAAGEQAQSETPNDAAESEADSTDTIPWDILSWQPGECPGVFATVSSLAEFPPCRMKRKRIESEDAQVVAEVGDWPEPEFQQFRGLPDRAIASEAAAVMKTEAQKSETRAQKSETQKTEAVETESESSDSSAETLPWGRPAQDDTE